jgi:hypothetical protein
MTRQELISLCASKMTECHENLVIQRDYWQELRYLLENYDALSVSSCISRATDNNLDSYREELMTAYEEAVDALK